MTATVTDPEQFRCRADSLPPGSA